MKKLLVSLLCVVMVVCFMPSMAWAVTEMAGDNTFMYNGIRYQITGDNTVKVISDRDLTDDFLPDEQKIGWGIATYSGSIVIPAQVTDGDGTTYAVTEIGAAAFESTKITGITLPDSIVSIGNRAFYSTNITEITLPDSVASIGELAFYSCKGLTSVKLSEEGLEKIGACAFEGCAALSDFAIPSTVTSIGTAAFGGCKSLLSLHIPAGVTENLAKALVGNTLYPHLDQVTVAEGSPYDIEGGVLYKGTAAQLYVGPDENVTVRTGTTEIAADELGSSGVTGAFAQNTGLKSIVLPDTITEIPAKAFYSAVNLETITLPSNLTAIGDRAFYNTGLTSIVLPDSVASIGTQAFQGCINMVSAELPDQLKTIGISAFQDNYSLQSIVIPEGVTEIPDQAFFGCVSLESISLPEGITTIGTSAFNLVVRDPKTGSFYNEEPKLEVINIPSTVTSIGNRFLGGLKQDGGTIMISNVADPSVFTEKALTGITKYISSYNGAPTLYYPASAKDAYEGENSTVKDFIPTASEDGSGESSTGGFSLALNGCAAVTVGKSADIGTAVVPSDAELVLEPATNSYAEFKLDESGKIIATGKKAGSVEVTFSIKKGTVVFASETKTITVTGTTSDGGGIPSTPSVQKPVIETSEGVTATLGSTGTTATITVADGYELIDVTVNGVSKGAVTTLTGLKTGDKVVITAQKVTSADDNAVLVAAVKNTRLVARSMYAKAPSGKKSIKVYWFNKDGSELNFDGYEVYRSLKKDSGYGTKPIFKTTKARYYNTAIKKGTKYYYKVRAYKVINGEKVYTQYSLKAWRIAK